MSELIMHYMRYPRDRPPEVWSVYQNVPAGNKCGCRFRVEHCDDVQVAIFYHTRVCKEHWHVDGTVEPIRLSVHHNFEPTKPQMHLGEVAEYARWDKWHDA